MFLMCFTTVASYHAFDNGQIIADARDLGNDEDDNESQGGSNTNNTTMIDAPAILMFLAENGNSAVVDHVAKKIYFTITIQAIDAFSSTPHCNSGKLTFQYDSTKFSVSDVSGTFMGAILRHDKECLSSFMSAFISSTAPPRRIWHCAKL